MFEVAIIGSGFGGISAAINLKRQGITNFVILERRSFCGGTWVQNTYPGAAVDVPSPLYSLKSEPFPWTHLYAKQDQLSEYTQNLFVKHDLNAHLRLSHVVKKACWQDDHWQLTIDQKENISAKTIINATGPLSTPYLPEFAGTSDYKGTIIHTNDWPKDLSLKGKNVAIIGNGASAVQVIPAIVDEVKSLHVVQRSPHWVIPRMDIRFGSILQGLMAYRFIYTFVRWLIYWFYELRVTGFKYSQSALKVIGQWPAKMHMRRQIDDVLLREKLTPDFTIGCKRIILSNHYYPALQKPQCTLHDKDDAIKSFTTRGIEFTSSGELDLDLIIFATGYKASDSIVSYEVLGENGKNLTDTWKEYPKAYLGTSIAGFPNFYVVSGPNTGIGHTSAIFMIESQMQYIMNCIKTVRKQDASSIQVSETAQNQYTSMIHKEMENTVWQTGGCNSWYKNAHGKVVAIFPGFTFNFRRMCKNFKIHHHQIKSK